MKIILTKILLLISIISYGQELTTIRVLAPNTTDEVFIVGNQEGFGDWKPDKVKMIKVSDYEREITLNLKLPAEYRFTRGNWESQAVITNPNGEPNFILNKKPSEKLFYKIEGWTDQIDKFSTFGEFKISEINSNILNQKRKIYISLPEDYEETIKYPVIYITDAQNLNNFEITQQTIRQQSKFENFPKTILVGINQSDRNADFGLNKETLYNENFQNFIFKELIPYIDKTYSTSNYKAVIGHSNGSEYNHYLLFADNNPFNAFVNISEEIGIRYPHMDQSGFNKSLNQYQQFFEHYSGKPIDLFVASGKYDFWHRLKAGKLIDSLYQAYSNTNINFKHKLYPAEHNSLVGQSMFDALQFIFKDFKNFEDFDTDLKSTIDYQQSKNNFLENSKQYGHYEITIEDDDIIQTIVFNTKNDEIFEQWNEIENLDNELYSDLILGLILTDVNPIKASQYFEKAFDQKDKEISKFLPTIIYNEVQVLNRYKDTMKKLDEILEMDQANKLVINYFIAKTSIENNIKLQRGKEALKYCKANYIENRYFTENDLQKLSEK